MVVRRLIFETCSNCGKKIMDDEAAILVDEHNDLIFCDDNCVQEYFETEIASLEKEHYKMRGEKDISPKTFHAYEHFLEMVLSEPDEIWEVDTGQDQAPLSFYIGEFFHEK